jgi:glucokinase
LIEKAGGPGRIKGIGLGAPNGNIYTGTIEYAPNLPWKGIIPLAKLVEDKFRLPVTLTNDANAAAIGEMMYGAAKGMKDFIMITLGTGVGSGIVANGKLIYGHDGFAGELGHTIVIPNWSLHEGTGKKGHWKVMLPQLVFA